MVELPARCIIGLDQPVSPTNAGACRPRSHDAASQGRGLSPGAATGHRHHTLLREASCSRKLCQGLAGRASPEAAEILSRRTSALLIYA